MTTPSNKRWALVLAALSISALAWSLGSHSWFVTKLDSSGDEASVAVSMGVWATVEVRARTFDGIPPRRELRNYELAAELEDTTRGAYETPDEVRDASIFWKAGIALLGFGGLGVFALAFAAISTFKSTRLARTVSPKGLVAISLLLAMVVSAVFISHVPGRAAMSTGRIVSGPALWIFYAASVLGFIANELLANHGAPDTSLPKATMRRGRC